MGGSNSGRYAWRNRGVVERHRSLDVRSLSRGGALVAGASATMRWGSGDSSVGLVCLGSRLLVGFTVDGQAHREVLELEHTACRFGGERAWFRCPVTECRRRVARVFYSSRRFVCRKCARLVYRTQRLDLSGRGDAKIRKAYRAMGLDPDEVELLESLPKPKGMHWSTYIQGNRPRNGDLSGAAIAARCPDATTWA
jgi:hypothetical protein